jgi:phosphatidylglycerol:prolipoprotein diacylglycerol transferase
MFPTLFHIGPIPIRTYGVMVLIGFLLALWYAMATARRRMAGRKPEEPGVITPEHVFDMAIVGLFVGIVGARLLYVLLDPGEFRERPLDILKTWTGGVTVVGAILAGIPYLWWYCRRHRLPFLAFADIAAPAFALGQAVGRIGCFLNGCCYGHACDLPWAMRFPLDEQGRLWTQPSHPTQLYATAMSLLIWFLLDRRSRRSHPVGELFIGYLTLYCISRFIEEHFRKGATASLFALGLTHAQAFCLLMLPVLLYLLWRVRRAPAQAAPQIASSDTTAAGG